MTPPKFPPAELAPGEQYRITIHAMVNGQLFVDFPRDESSGQKLAEKLLDMAKKVVQETSQPKTLVHLAGSDFDVNQHLKGTRR